MKRAINLFLDDETIEVLKNHRQHGYPSASALVAEAIPRLIKQNEELRALMKMQQRLIEERAMAKLLTGFKEQETAPEKASEESMGELPTTEDPKPPS